MIKKGLIVIGIVLLGGFLFSQVYAHGTGSGWGGGWGHGYMMGPGYGGRMMGPGYGGHMMGPGYGYEGRGYGPGGYYGENREQAEKWDKFADETRDLRRDLRQKYLEMDALLNQKSPDETKVLAKQKEISQLQAQLEEKEIQFRLENPDVGGTGGTNYGYCYGPGSNR